MIKKIAAAAALAILSTAAVAAGPVYVGADVGTTKVDGFGRENSYGIFAGYKFTPAFAVEANFRRLATYDFSVGTTRGDVSLDQTGLSLIGTMPINEAFNVYGRLGYNHAKAKASISGYTGSGSDSSAMYGIGLGYNFSDTVSGRVEVQKPGSDTTNVSFGVAFNF